MADESLFEAHSLPAGQFIPPAVRLVLLLLGSPQVLVNGEPAIELKGQKVLALLAYLALEASRPHRREALAALFWPEQPEKQGLQNLRQTLSRLRRALHDEAADPPHLLIESQTIRFNRQSDYWLDVVAFQALLAAAERHPHRRLEVCPACLSQLARAVEVYRGELLAHLYPADSLAFDEWLLISREQLGQQVCTALQALANAHLAQGEYRAAARYARRLLRLEPWDETAQRLLLCALAQDQGRNAALRQYQTFHRALLAELGVEPEDETQALAAAIRGGTLSHGPLCAPATRLPVPVTPLIGRQPELQQIGEHLAGRERRLLTLYGPGGGGKSRLALEVAAGQAALWRDGAWFIPLAETSSPAALVDALAAVLGLPAGGQPVDAKHLLDFLRPKELLLVLDGFEHLTAGASLLADILRWAPEVRILVTSRSRLGARGEWAMQLDGLKFPPEANANVAEAEDFSAIQLFVLSARRVAPDFHLTAENLPHVVRICRLVGGLPLGIELASAWVRLYRCQQIAEQIAGSLDFLHIPGTDESQGHGSLRGTFDYSYGLLSEPERALLRRLSVFRGGFTVAAARQIAGAAPPLLDSLLDKSLLQTSPARRLDLHLTLREYAAGKLAEGPENEAGTRTEHGRFYMAFLRERQESIAGERVKEALDEIQGELSNIRAAWRWAATEGFGEELEGGLDALAGFYSHKGYLREAEAAFGEAAVQAAALANQHLACRLLIQRAAFLRRLADYGQAIQVAQAAVARAQSAQEPLCEAMAAAVWGEALWRQGEFSAAREQLARALVLARALPDGGKVAADSLNSLAGVCWRQGNYAGARKCLEDCLQLASHTGRTRPRSIVLGNLGVVAVEQGDYVAARRCYREALDIEREIGERAGESVSLTNLGNLSLYLGAYTEAETYYQQALVIHRETGAREYEAWTLGNIGLLAHYRDDQEAAQGCARAALQMAQEIGDRAMQATMWLELGHALTGLARLGEAAEAYRESLALRRELDQPNMATESLAGLARVCQVQGDLGRAQAHVEEILQHLGLNSVQPTSDREPASGQTLDGTLSPFQIYLTCCRILEAAQDARAQGILDTAHERLVARAARINDEKMRCSFLENVAAHRELVRAFEREKASAP